MLFSGRDDCSRGIGELRAFKCKFGHAIGTSAHDADESTQGANEGYFAGFLLPEVRENRTSYVYSPEQIGVALL